MSFLISIVIALLFIPYLREHGIQIVLQVPHPREPDSFPEYDCHISYAFLSFVVGKFLCPEVSRHKNLDIKRGG